MPHPAPITTNPTPPAGGRWTQAEAAMFLGVSVRYLRDSACPKILLPGHGKRGQSLLRYSPMDVMAWASKWRTERGGNN
jgi:hypothetical protein